MVARKRLATFAAAAAVALVPAFGAQAAQAGIPGDLRLVPCKVKWVLAPGTTSVFDTRQSSTSGGGFDVENQTSDGRDNLDYETVAADDLTYDPC